MTASAAPHAGMVSEPQDLGILFVHGIGDQPRGETLVAFGTPLVDWLSKRASQLGAEVDVRQTVLNPDGPDPAFADVQLRMNETTRRWTFAETWWAESFAIRPFDELSGWAFSIIPWTFGAHFGRQLLRAWRAPHTGWVGLIRWSARVVASGLTLLGGMLLSLVMLAVFAGLGLVAVIPWQWLRSGIQRLQVRLAATIGDSFILATRPLEGAAIITKFQRDLDWLLSRCRKVAVVAHSQGAAVATLGLAERPADRVGLLVTFGSGLRKLEELRELQRSRSLRRGAALTIGGLVIVSIVALGVILYFLSPSPRSGFAKGEGLLIALIYAAVGLPLLIAGIKDFASPPEPPRLARLKELIVSKGIVWKDLFATADPVSNGPLESSVPEPGDDVIESNPEPIAVTNRSSIFVDHTGYWQNVDDFVTRVADYLLSYDGSSIMPRLQSSTIAELSNRRRRRVLVLRAAELIAVGAAVSLLFRHGDAWYETLAWLFAATADKIAGVFGGSVDAGPIPGAGAWGNSFGWLLAVLVPFAFTHRLWSAADRRETEMPPPYRYEGDLTYFVSAGLWFQQLAIAGVWTGAFPGGWLWLGTFVISMALTIPFVGTAPKRRVAGAETAAPPKKEEIISSADRVAALLIAIVSLAAFGFGLVLVVRDGVRMAGSLLTKYAGVANPSWSLSATVLAIAFLAVSLTLGGLATLARRRTRRPDVVRP